MEEAWQPYCHGNSSTSVTVFLTPPTRLLGSVPSTAAMCMRYFPCPALLPLGGSQGPPVEGSWLLPKLWPNST